MMMKRFVFVSNARKIKPEPSTVYYSYDYLTIGELNGLFHKYQMEISFVDSDYRSDGLLALLLNVDCGSNSLLNCDNECISYSLKYNATEDDLSIEDNVQLCSPKLYCVSSKKKNPNNKSFFEAHECITIPELNHILSVHRSEILWIKPVYKTGEESFVMINFLDTFIPKIIEKPRYKFDTTEETSPWFRGLLSRLIEPENRDEYIKKIASVPLKGDRLFYVTSKEIKAENHAFYSNHDCLSVNEFNSFFGDAHCDQKSQKILNSDGACIFSVVSFFESKQESR